MLMLLMGHKDLDFESNGKRIKGKQMFAAFPEEGVTGQRTEKLFFKDGIPLPDLQPGMYLEVSFNHKGKPEKVTVAQTTQRVNLNKQ